jgi:hypothetical protein
LVPVEIVEHGVSVETRRATGVDFQVQLESGTTLHVPAGFDEGDLRRLVRALRC